MMNRFSARAALAALALSVFGSAAAEPIDTWETYPGYDCTNDPFNPILPDGSRDPDGDPAPNTAEWDERDAQHVACTDQRDHDARLHPLRNVATAFYGEDVHRQPELLDGIRFHWEEFLASSIPDVPSAEIYYPCSNAPGDCPDLPPALQRFDPPYPVVVVFHGIIAQYSHHRFITQALAEHGYLAVGVNGTIPAGSGPNSQRTENGDDVLNWLASPDSGLLGEMADLDRVAFAGHSQGGGASLSYQGDPRVHALVIYDAGDSVNEANVAQPTMFQRTDGGFATPSARSDYPADRDRAVVNGYTDLTTRGVDIFNFTARATVHTDWNGYGVGLAGNRYIELVINYYTLAWVDRYLKGRLVLDENGEVVTSGGRSAAEERALRQGFAADAFARLTARFFDDSADRHNISMGFWDPEQALASDDPLLGGNVPYTVAGLETRDRFSPYYQSVCSLALPDYLNGGSGAPDDPVPPLERADTTATGDMRFIGCPEVSVGGGGGDADGDGVPDTDDLCAGTPPGAEVDANGCTMDDPGVDPITVTLAASPDSGDVTDGPLTVSFTATPSDSDASRGALSYTFYFGDGTFEKQAGNTIEHDYGAAGRYTAYAIVADENGNSARSQDVVITTTTTVTVQPEGTTTMADLKLSFSPASGVAPVTAVFDGSGSTAATGRSLVGYELDFGDGTTDIGNGTPGSAIRHAYTTPGTFTATLTVTDSEGDTSQATAMLTVTAEQATTAQLTVSPSTVQVGNPVTFDGSASIEAPGTTITQYLFDPDDGTDPVAQAEPTYEHSYTAPGEYMPSLTVTDSDGATSKVFSSPVTVRPAPADTGATPRRSGSGAPGLWLLLAAFAGAWRRMRP